MLLRVLEEGLQGRAAESQGHGWSEVTSLASTARRLPLVCFLLEEKAELTSVFQASSQTGIILLFPVENRWFFGKTEISHVKFLFCGNCTSDEKNSFWWKVSNWLY